MIISNGAIRLCFSSAGKEKIIFSPRQPPLHQQRIRSTKDWKSENMVMPWSINSITKETGEDFMYYKTAKEI